VIDLLPTDQRTRIERLFRQYGRGIGSYIRARVGDADTAENITSSVFLIVVRRIDQCRSSPAAWLWSIVRSELARHFRQVRPTVELQESILDPAQSPPEMAARNEMQTLMRDALGRLSEEQQQVIYMKFFLDMANTDIAAELKLGVSNVGVIAHRAMRQLREMMEIKLSGPQT
jgi:RNA polymerase sigma-70 factor (ECF subfamily)